MTISTDYLTQNIGALTGGMASNDTLTAYYKFMLSNTLTVNGMSGPLLPGAGLSILASGAAANTTNVLPAMASPAFQFTFDTIGQTIFRSIGHCRLPLRVIWAQGINESGDTSTSPTQTFAAALCAPIDPLEDGVIFAIWDGGSQIFNSSGAATPAGWSAQDAALLANSLNNVLIFPGDESQLPASLIVADKGVDKTNAFRGLRYLIFQDYPIGGGGHRDIPHLSVGFQRTTAGGTTGGIAVNFAAGSG